MLFAVHQAIIHLSVAIAAEISIKMHCVLLLSEAKCTLCCTEKAKSSIYNPLLTGRCVTRERANIPFPRQAKISPSTVPSLPSVQLSCSKPAQHHYHPTATALGAYFCCRCLCSPIVCEEGRQTVWDEMACSRQESWQLMAIDPKTPSEGESNSLFLSQI